MAGVNKVIILGNLGEDPRTMFSQNGLAVTDLLVATSEKWRDKSTGESREQTEWHKVTLFGRLAEIAQQYLSKGDKVFIGGSLRTEKYADKDGIERYTTKIIGKELQLLGSKSSSNNNKQQNQQQAAAAYRDKKTSYAHNQSGYKFNDDIPF